MNCLLDTSALLAFYFGEPGGERVQEIVGHRRAVVRLSVLSMAEFWGRLRAEGWDQVFSSEWNQLKPLISHVEPVSEAVVRRSNELRLTASARLPLIDALIAATASVHEAVLVHRDPHFQSIPDGLLRQEYLLAS